MKILQFTALIALCFLPKLVFAQQNQPAPIVRAQSQTSIRWVRSAALAAQEAAKSGKPILIFVRSKNCIYCDKLQQNVLNQRETIETVRTAFVPLMLTKETDSEFIQSLKIKGYPATFVFSPSQQFVHRIDGYLPQAQYLSEVLRAKQVAVGTTASVKR